MVNNLCLWYSYLWTRTSISITYLLWCTYMLPPQPKWFLNIQLCCTSFAHMQTSTNIGEYRQCLANSGEHCLTLVILFKRDNSSNIVSATRLHTTTEQVCTCDHDTRCPDNTSFVPLMPFSSVTPVSIVVIPSITVAFITAVKDNNSNSCCALNL